MKFKLEIGGTSAILTAEQLETIINTLASAERFEEKWLGNNKGPNGSHYIKLIRPCQPSEHLRISCMSDDEYVAQLLITKLEDEKNAPD